MKKNKIFKWIIVAIAIGTIALLFFYFKNTIFDIIKYANDNNEEAINQLLKEKGILGLLTVPLIEALQMIVVFISAEPIQIASGISYPWWLSIILCDIGVCLGATIIFFLVRIIKLDPSTITKNKKIEDINKRKKKQNGMQALMYLLFVMPIIPFGAICYFASNSKIKYKNYIFTCATGVIPSIATSILMGKLFLFCTEKNISIWVLILCIIAVGAILFMGAMLILNKCFLNDEGSIDSSLYPFLMRTFGFIVKSKTNVKFDKGNINIIDGPFILVSNHASFFDFYYSTKLIYPKRVHIICNRFYFRNKIVRFIFKKLEIIPKKLFNPDLETIKLTLKYVKNGESILIYPEGRLCLDGTSYKIVEGTGALVKKLGIPVVISNIEGAYLTNPKWRNKRIKGNVNVSVKDIINPEDIINMNANEIEERINKGISINDFEYSRINNIEYRSKKKAEGLDGILYYCPNCGNVYTLETNNNEIECNHCHTKFIIKDNYSFEDNNLNIKDIHEYYDIQAKYERSILDSYNDEDVLITQDVKVEVKNMNDKKLDKIIYGSCTLTKKLFKFESNDNSEYNFEYTIKQLNALAFSANIEFECYYKDHLYYFYPLENKKQCVRWALLVDEMNNNRNL